MDIGAEYERLIVPCHECGRTNIISRSSDLSDTGFAIGKELPCQNPHCEANVRVSLEAADPDYQLMIWEATRLRGEKRYMLAVAALAQAFEMFFALAVEVMLIHHVANFGNATEDELTKLAGDVYEATERFTYWKMRNLFISVAVRPRPSSVSEAAQIIGNISALAKERSDTELSSSGDPRLTELLFRLMALTIGNLRNRVVHKIAYRPRVQELNESLGQATRLTGELWVTLELSRSLRGD